MRRRIEESVLDDCPGINENRKKILLKRFGSVARLKRAGVDKIAEIQGISAKSAEVIKQFLN